MTRSHRILICAGLTLVCIGALSLPWTVGASVTPQVDSLHQDNSAQKTVRPQRPIEELLNDVAGPKKNEAEAWFQLGLAYSASENTSEARKAFKQANKLQTSFAAARIGIAHTLFVEGKLKDAIKEAAAAIKQAKLPNDIETAYSLRSTIQSEIATLAAERDLSKAERELAKKPNDARWHLLKAQSLILAVSRDEPRKPLPLAILLAGSADRATESARAFARAVNSRNRFEAAAASFEKYLSLAPAGSDVAFAREQFDALNFYAGRTNEIVHRALDVTTKAVIIAKPDPPFTEAARSANVSGVVRLRAVLSASGEVKHILVLRPLTHGLSERAVSAAKAIRFRPATINGVTVSQFITLEYNFNIY